MPRIGAFSGKSLLRKSWSDRTVIEGFCDAAESRGKGTVALTQSMAYAEQIVKEFMDGLRRAVDELEMQPNEAGDYVLPDDMQKAIAPSRDGGVMQIVEEFDMTLPDWAQPLVDEYKAGTISEQRKELLIMVIYGTLIPKLS